MFDGSQVNLLIAFIGGIITFFASCLLPLVPTYLAYLSGLVTSRTEDDSHKKIFKRDIFINGFIFTLGFIFIFVLLGATTNTLGRMLGLYKPLIHKLGGVLFIFMGLFMLKIIKPMFLYRERKISLPVSPTRFRKLNSFLVGITFGFAWTPCIGPVLAVILFWSAQADSLLKGISLLLAYGIGLGLPFLVVALFFEQISSKLSSTKKIGKYLNIIAAFVIIFMGFLLVLGKVELVSMTLLKFFDLNTLAV